MFKILVTGASGSIGSALMSLHGTTAYNARNPITATCENLIVAHGHEQNVWDSNVFSLIKTLQEVTVTNRTVVICSRRSLIPTMAELEYSASKAAAYAICRARYDAGHNITALCPGWIESRMSQEAAASKVIPIQEMVRTVQWLLGLSARVREVLMEPKA